MTGRLLAAAAAAVGLLAFTATAGATTLGVSAPPASSASGTCSGGAVYSQYADDPSTPYFVPAGGGQITQWQTYTAGDTPGSSLTFVVLRSAAAGGYTVVGADTEILPNPLPASNVASFTLSDPIQVAAGDTLGLSVSAHEVCYFDGGSVPSLDTAFIALATYPATVGEALPVGGTGRPEAINVAATLIRDQDAGVQTSVFPSATDNSGAALLRSVVTNGGPDVAPITFVDQVPSGVQIQSAFAGLGTCAISGQTVTCTINGLPAGQSTAVDVVVTSPTAGTYSNTVSVSVGAGAIDPNAANNAASASLLVTALPRECIVPGLRKTPMGTARTLLRQLGCTVRLVREHSSIGKGLVIGVRGGVRTYPYQQQVTLLVSSGPKRKHKKHHLAR